MYYVLSDEGIVREFQTADEAIAWVDNQPDTDDLWISTDDEDGI